MGYGDDLLVTSLAAKIKKQFPERQIVIGIAEKNHAFHSPIYENNPNIADCRNLDNNKPIHLIDFHELNRPYIDYEKSIPNNYVWRNFKPIPGEIYFSDQDVLRSATKESLLIQTNSFIDFCKENKLSNDELKALENLRNNLVQNLLNQQFIPTHNDFERRNLMMFEENLFVIDFQDLNMGPIGIDLASIMYEHSYEYPKVLIDDLLEKHLKNNGLKASSEELKNMIMHALAHRSMRIVGAFNKYFKEGKLLNRKSDLDKFLKRIYLALSTLKKDEAKIVKKLL